MMLQTVIIVLFAVLTALYWFTPLSSNEKFSKYISVLSVLSTLVVVASFIFSMQQSRKQQEEKERQEFMQDTNQYWVSIQGMFMKEYPYLQKLYSELYSSNPEIVVPPLTDEQKTEARAKEEQACQTLLQTIENIVLTRKVSETHEVGWYNIFKSWLKSPTLKNSWINSKSFYNTRTAEFIESVKG